MEYDFEWVVAWIQNNFIKQEQINHLHSDLYIAGGFSRLMFHITREELVDAMTAAGFKSEKYNTCYCFNVSDASPAFEKIAFVFE